MMKKFFLLFGIASLFLLIGCTMAPSGPIPEKSGKLTVLSSPVHDWKEIDIMGGDVKHSFRLKNDSFEPLFVKRAETSCMCTTAQYRLVDGRVSPKFGMHSGSLSWEREVAPGEEFEVEAVFDPMAHGPKATGPIQRNIKLFTTAGEMELKVMGNVLSSDAFKMLQKNVSNEVTMGDFIFEEREFDFGTIKQSGGIVEHKFAFRYEGDTPIKVTGVPGSCACTTGVVSKKELKKGDRATLTLKFDPNLHAEPEGRFHKSVSILTDPKLEVTPEIKMWAEIDLDLGPQAFKLKEKHDIDDDHSDEVVSSEGRSFYPLKPEKLKGMLANKDFFLLDVHIPEQEHIAGTDKFIDYREIKNYVDDLPSDKNAKIVVYCRSGSMSRSAAHDLLDLGYTNVWDLEGGINAFNSL